jgi:hypothetical protein
MPSNEPWRAVKPSASAPTGQDPLAEAFKSAVNAFGRPDKMANYVDGLRGPNTTSTRAHSSATTSLPSSSNVIDAAHQGLPSSSRVSTQGLESQGHTPHVEVLGSSVHPTTSQHRIVQPQTSPSVLSNNAGQEHPSKRRRVTGTGAIASETPNLPPAPIDRDFVMPRGAENCLSGCIFVFSGELPNMSRPQATTLIESHGGQVVLIPNESTTHSVLGFGVTKNKLTILDRFQIVPLDEPLLIQMIQEMPANGRWEESPVQEDQSGATIVEGSSTMAEPSGESVNDAPQHPSEISAPPEDTIHVADNDRTGQSWPFNEPPNLIRHVPVPNPAQETQTIVKDEPTEVPPIVDAPPKINRVLREQYAKSWGTPQVRRGHLEKIKFAVNYEKGESRLVKYEVRRRGGKIVRVSEAHVLVIDRLAFSIANDQALLKYRPDWQIWSEHFFEAFPPLEDLPFEVDREASAGSIDHSSSEAGSSGVAGNADGAVAITESSSLDRPLQQAATAQDTSRPSQRISRAQAKYEDLIAQRDAIAAVHDRKWERSQQRRHDYYDRDSEEARAIQEELDNEERPFRPPSPAVPPIMEEVASDGYASSCDEHEIHRAVINPTRRMRLAKVKKGFLIQVKMLLRGPNGATVNALNGKPGVTRTMRVPAAISFRQLTDVLNIAFGWVGDREWDYLIATNLGKWSNVEPPPCQYVARVKKVVTQSTAQRAVPDEEEAYIQAREIRLFDVWGRHQPRQCQNLQVWYNYHAEIEYAHQISFLGEANDRLFEASRMEEDRKYWCIAGEGHAHPEDHPGDLDKWRKKTNLWAWDMVKIDKELAFLEETSLHR